MARGGGMSIMPAVASFVEGCMEDAGHLAPGSIVCGEPA